MTRKRKNTSFPPNKIPKTQYPMQPMYRQQHYGMMHPQELPVHIHPQQQQHPHRLRSQSPSKRHSRQITPDHRTRLLKLILSYQKNWREMMKDEWFFSISTMYTPPKTIDKIKEWYRNQLKRIRKNEGTARWKSKEQLENMKSEAMDLFLKEKNVESKDLLSEQDKVEYDRIDALLNSRIEKSMKCVGPEALGLPHEEFWILEMEKEILRNPRNRNGRRGKQLKRNKDGTFTSLSDQSLDETPEPTLDPEQKDTKESSTEKVHGSKTVDLASNSPSKPENAEKETEKVSPAVSNHIDHIGDNLQAKLVEIQHHLRNIVSQEQD